MSSPPRWTFLTNHAHVLLCLGREPNLRLRDVADRVGITERAVARIVSELVRAGYLNIIKNGRRNAYTVSNHLTMRHPLEEHVAIGELLALVDDAA